MSELEYWKRGISRRRALRGAGVLGAGLSAAALVGCGSGVDDAPAAKATTAAGGAAASNAPAKPTGKIRQGSGKLSEPFDPAIMLSAGPIYWNMIGDLALNANKQTFKLEPGLVESWETKSPTEIALTVRQGVKFHAKEPTNGRVMDAKDIAFSLMRHAALLDKEKAAIYPRRSNFAFMTEATAVDNKTVVLKMSKPNSAILNGMADKRTPIIPVELKDTAAYTDGNKITGTGPFMIKDMDTEGNGTLVANVDYWDQGFPKIAEIEKRSFDTYQANTAAFLGDAVDQLIMTNQSAEIIATVKKSRPDATELRWDYGYLHYKRFGMTRKPFDDQRVRKALTLAADLTQLGEGYYGPGMWEYTGPLVSTWPEAIPAAEIKKRPGWNPATREADIAEAKKLLEAAGIKDGEMPLTLLVFNTPVHPAGCERLRAQWNRVWPKMKITLEGPLNSGPMNQRLAAGTFDVVSYGNLPTTDGAVEFSNFYASTGSRNYGKYKNAEIDTLVEKALGEFNLEARKKLLLDGQEIVIKDAPIIPEYYAKMAAFISPKWKGDLKQYVGPGGQSGADLVRMSKYVTV